MKDIFISYRRADSSDVTGRIFDRLTEHFGADRVFKDVDSIPLGLDFRESISSELAQCKAMVVVVGKEWLAGSDVDRRQRIFDDDDYVHIEIATALERQIPVIPVLVKGARVPEAEELPQALREFAFRNGTPVRPDPDFDHDIRRLIRNLESHVSAYVKNTKKPDVDFLHHQAELRRTHPLLDVDRFLEVISEGGWPGWNPPSFGVLGLGSLSLPKSKGDLIVSSFHSGYVFQVVLCVRAEERYSLNIAFSRNHRKDLMGMFEAKEAGDFWKSTKEIGIELDSVKDIDCIYCNSPHSSETDTEAQRCDKCKGVGMTACKLNCKRGYPHQIVLLSFSDSESKEELRSQKFEVFLETPAQSHLKPEFPVSISGLSEQQISCIKEKYMEATHDLELIRRNASIRNPESVIDSNVNRFLSNVEMVDPYVEFQAFKLVVRGAPAYHVKYHRSVSYERGMLWNKKTYRARVDGEVWAHGYKPVYVLQNTEEIASESATT